MSCTCAPTNWRVPTKASSRRAISTSNASISIRRLRQPGSISDAAIASSRSSSTARLTRRAPNRARSRARAQPSLVGGAQVPCATRSRHGPVDQRPGASARAGGAARQRSRLFSGLVHSCRYCGLFEQAIDAHAGAKRLDPNAPSTIEQTILMTGDIERLLALRPRSAGRAAVIRASE